MLVCRCTKCNKSSRWKELARRTKRAWETPAKNLLSLPKQNTCNLSPKSKRDWPASRPKPESMARAWVKTMMKTA